MDSKELESFQNSLLRILSCKQSVRISILDWKLYWCAIIKVKRIALASLTGITIYFSKSWSLCWLDNLVVDTWVWVLDKYLFVIFVISAISGTLINGLSRLINQLSPNQHEQPLFGFGSVRLSAEPSTHAIISPRSFTFMASCIFRLVSGCTKFV